MKRPIVCLFFLCAAVLSASGRYGMWRQPSGDAPDKASRALRIVAYNVGVFSKYTGDSTPDIADMMIELGADAIAVCEQDSCNRRHNTFQTQDFAEQLGPEWDYRFGSAMQWNGGSYGTGAVTSRKIIRSSVISIPKGNGYEPRVCVAAETADYVIAAVHLDHSNEDVRMEQASLLTDELVRLYGRSRKPVFLCGDLNATPDSPTLRQLSEDWTVLSEPALTYPSQNPEICIDYILVLKNRARYRLLKTAVCTEFESADVSQASDHLPVFADVMIR